VRHPDLVARLAGDEFAILLENVEDVSVATAVAQRVLDALGAPMLIAGKELQPTASVGIAIGDAHYHDADEVLRDADIALYRAKDLGRKRFELFDETLAKNVVDVLAMEVESSPGNAARSVRAVLSADLPARWRSGGGLRGADPLESSAARPAAAGGFLKIAEDSGLIEDDRLAHVRTQLRPARQSWSDDTFMTFNVSALHLRRGDFDTRLIQLLDKTGLPPSRLVAEVTEGALLDNPERVRGTLDRLRRSAWVRRWMISAPATHRSVICIHCHCAC
jgi:predicted signal transduction protein with EAL and GGDEF domain